MKKSVLWTLAALSALSLCACGNAGAPEQGSVEETPAASGDEDKSAGETDTKEAKAEEDTKAEEAVESIAIDYDFKDRFVWGNRNLFYIEDDGRLTCEFKGGENDIIQYAGGDENNYFFLVSTIDQEGYTIYFLDTDRKLSTAILSRDIYDGYVNSANVYKGCLYFGVYNSDAGRDDIYYYDPKGDAFNRDDMLERLDRQLDNHSGTGLTRAVSGRDLFQDLAVCGRIYMKDEAAGVVSIFDEEGKELSSFDLAPDDYSLEYYESDYMLGKGETDDGTRTTYTRLYDVDEGKYYDFLETSQGEIKEIVGVKDGFVYYYEEEKTGGESQALRTYYRMSVEDIKAGAPKPQKVVDIYQYPQVQSSYGNYSMGSFNYDGFTVKKDRAYYLVFDREGEDAKKGSVVWRSVALGDEAAEEQHTGAVERQEGFSDFGYLTIDYDRRHKDDDPDFDYFVGSYECFELYDDVPSSASINAALREKDESYKKQGDDVAETALRDIYETDGESGEDNSAWFKEFVGAGYTFDKSFAGAQEVGDHYLQIAYSGYEYFGGAHGMGYTEYFLFDENTGKQIAFSDLYSGSEEEFKKIAIDYSMDDWKNDTDYKYYDEYSEDKEGEMKATFSDSISMDMTMFYDNDGVNICFPAYAVGPYASGDISVRIPYYALDIDIWE